MTRDAQEAVDLFQGPTRRARAKKMEDEQNGLTSYLRRGLASLGIY